MPYRSTINDLVDELIKEGVDPHQAWCVITDAISIGLHTGVYRTDNQHHRKVEEVEQTIEEYYADPETDAVVTAATLLEG